MRPAVRRKNDEAADAVIAAILTMVVNFFFLGWMFMLAVGDLGLHVGYWTSAAVCFLLRGSLNVTQVTRK